MPQLPSFMPQCIFTVIDQGQAHQHVLSLFYVPNLAAKVKQLDGGHRAMGLQFDDLRASYDLGFFQAHK